MDRDLWELPTSTVAKKNDHHSKQENDEITAESEEEGSVVKVAGKVLLAARSWLGDRAFAPEEAAFAVHV